MLKTSFTGMVLVLLLAFIAIGEQAAQPQRGPAAPLPEPKVVRIDPAFDAIAPAGAAIEKVAGNFGFVEGPVWTRQNSLIFSDLPGNAIMRVTPAGVVSVFRQPIYYGTAYRQGFHIGSNGLTLDPQGRVVIAEHGNRRVTRVETTGELTVLADKVDGKRLNSPNDVVVKSDGSVYFTDPPYGLPQQNTDPAKEIPYSGIYRIKSGKVELLSQETQWPNGIGFSPDERFLYVANSDPMKRFWMRFEVKPDGTLGPGSPFYMVPADGPAGIPDGLKLDTAGNLYGTGPGGIWVISPAGTLLGRIEPSEVAANVAWGEDGKTLYITARTSIYRIRLTASGKQPCC